MLVIVVLPAQAGVILTSYYNRVQPARAPRAGGGDPFRR